MSRELRFKFDRLELKIVTGEYERTFVLADGDADLETDSATLESVPWAADRKPPHVERWIELRATGTVVEP